MESDIQVGDARVVVGSKTSIAFLAHVVAATLRTHGVPLDDFILELNHQRYREASQ